jgi:hypothetical protein
MLTEKFWKLAEKHKKTWTAVDFDTYRWERLHLVGTETHCGSAEIANLEKDTLVELVCLISKWVIYLNEGHFLYYCPHQPKFLKAVKKFELLGAKFIFTFHHLGYLTRKPDWGLCDLWSLGVLPKEAERLQKIKESCVQVHKSKQASVEGEVPEVSIF